MMSVLSLSFSFKGVIVVGICLLYLSCNTAIISDEDIIVLTQEYDIKTNIPRTVGQWKSRLYIDENQDTCLVSLDIRKIQINFINLKQKIITDSIDVKLYPQQFISDFHIVSSDSILLAFMPSYLGDVHDRAIVIVNREKTIIDTFSLSGLPVRMSENRNKNHHYSVDYVNFPLIYHHGILFTSILNDRQVDYCDDYTAIGMIDHKHGDSFSPISIKFPCRSGEEYFFHRRFREANGCFTGKNLYVGFGHAPVIYDYDLEMRHVMQHHFSFFSIDSILPYKGTSEDYPNIPSPDPYKAEYEMMRYDPFNETIIWHARIQSDSTDSPLSRKNSIHSFAIIDKQMKKIGEGLIPDGYYQPFIPYNGGLLATNTRANNNTLVYTYFSYKIEKKTGGIFKKSDE